jgi:hypothetical protein
MEVPGWKSKLQGKLQQMFGIQPVTVPKPPKVIKTCTWPWCDGGVGCTRCCAMSAALVPSSCNQGCGRCAHQLSERAHASGSCLSIKHKSPETNKHVVMELCKRRGSCPGAVGGNAVISPESRDDFVVFPTFYELLCLEGVINISRMRIWSSNLVTANLVIEAPVFPSALGGP